ncbi:hypothetical protein [Ovoidimarina sediminis]|uniref:hypothetical protein n=1 Tax=Ovoidimarina sediminis TaxID=3079856 RepID=UPI0029064B55|nr:hypothetical protein [Rhodophyticola sp. MJ-SS7]MDU8945932.1 hypothetical protein [Rhodophyticola sp. MJ-SS7]
MAIERPSRLQALASNLSKNEKAQVSFMQVFGEEYFARPFGTTPKSELDLLIFRALAAAKQIDPNGPIFSIASALQITPAKARSLQMQYFLRANISDGELSEMLAEAFEKTRPTVDKNDVRFGIEQTYLRAALEAKIKEQQIYADISGEVLRIPKDHFGEAMAALLDPERKAAFERALRASGVKVNDAVGFFSQLQKEFLDGVKGKAIGEATDKFWETLRDVFSGETDYGTLIEGLAQVLGS